MIVSVTGGSGFIGTEIVRRLVGLGHQVIVLDIRPPRISHPLVEFIQTDFSDGSVSDRVLQADAVIHLAGTTIFKRWTSRYKREILESRIRPIQQMLQVAKSTGHAPKTFVSASAVGWYGNDREEEILDESSSPGEGFLAGVCSSWESEARSFESVGSRVVMVRTAIVLGPGGGMMSSVLPIFKLGLGGKFGSGTQWFSWIHIDDLVSVYIRTLTDATLSGPVNASSPYPVTNREFTRELAAALHRPAFLRIPGRMLRVLLGEFSSAVLGSLRILPKKLQQAGFRFEYPALTEALQKIQRPR